MNSVDEVQATLEQDKRKLTIVFDIDDTLATHNSLDDTERLYISRKSMFIVASSREHQVLPGTMELMQFL